MTKQYTMAFSPENCNKILTTYIAADCWKVSSTRDNTTTDVYNSYLCEHTPAVCAQSLCQETLKRDRLLTDDTNLYQRLLNQEIIELQMGNELFMNVTVQKSGNELVVVEIDV